ncbi:preprotein translocase subunit SecE [Corynebacterium incognita]|uniref:Protein translocase subunit SecE n=1 Tax=Corynebacterium incognita TaxID=2754725 RepID=A0A7G7CMR1_9CORY|nr:preprotein translocase subunit SecE [Corynebacterium incognita]QNE88877.1 preprotein translocase subunit SecE [Corynebacterium incognita]
MSEKQPDTQGAARPTGKRQMAGVQGTSSAAYTEKRIERAETSDDSTKTGGGVGSFVPEVVTEVKKVVWPTSKEMVQYTLITFAFLIVLTALVWGVDTLTGLGVEKILVP